MAVGGRGHTDRTGWQLVVGQSAKGKSKNCLCSYTWMSLLGKLIKD